MKEKYIVAFGSQFKNKKWKLKPPLDINVFCDDSLMSVAFKLHALELTGEMELNMLKVHLCHL